MNYRDPVPHLPPCILDPEKIVCMPIDQAPYHSPGEIWYALHWINPFDKGKPSKSKFMKNSIYPILLLRFRLL